MCLRLKYMYSDHCVKTIKGIGLENVLNEYKYMRPYVRYKDPFQDLISDIGKA